MIPPPYPSKGMDVLAWSQRLWEFVMVSRPVTGPGLLSRETSTGTIFSLGKQSTAATRADGYPFAEIIRYKSGSSMVTGIRGGVVQAGGKTWNVPNHALTLSASGEFLVWLEVGCTLNTGVETTGDPPEDVTVLSAGIADSEEPVWTTGPVADGYPDHHSFSATSPSGKVIVALGALSIADGQAKLTPHYLGSVAIFHDGWGGITLTRQTYNTSAPTT